MNEVEELQALLRERFPRSISLRLTVPVRPDGHWTLDVVRAVASSKNRWLVVGWSTGKGFDFSTLTADTGYGEGADFVDLTQGEVLAKIEALLAEPA